MNLVLKAEYWAGEMFWSGPPELFQGGLCFVMLMEFEWNFSVHEWKGILKIESAYQKLG